MAPRRTQKSADRVIQQGRGARKPIPGWKLGKRKVCLLLIRPTGFHSAIRRKLLDREPPSADSLAYRATRVASDVIARTVQAGSKLGAGRGVSGVDRHGRQAFAARDVGGAGAPRTTRGTYREWAEWVGGTPRRSLTSPEEKRTSPYRKSRLRSKTMSEANKIAVIAFYSQALMEGDIENAFQL